jgi:hypothetical protein
MYSLDCFAWDETRLRLAAAALAMTGGNVKEQPAGDMPLSCLCGYFIEM